MSYTVTQVSAAADLALAIAAIDEYTELVEIVEVDGGYWLITEPDDEVALTACCCDCHNDNTEATNSVYMSSDPTDLIKGINDAFDKVSELFKKR